MMNKKKNISISLDEDTLNMINEYAESRHISRSSAVSYMLGNVRVIVINEGSEILKALYSLDTLLKNRQISSDDKTKIERMCNQVWQLLNLITEKIQQPAEE